MLFARNRIHPIIVVTVMLLIVAGGCRRHKYENPISKDTQQPDKVLFDKAINDIERGRYEVARLTLNTLINTYDTSEFLAKAKLAIADSWFREGGTHAWAQAEAEYKDFILFYPTMEEAAESQEKVCDIHYKQMEKADRDRQQAIRAEDECRQLLVQFPNSKFAPDAQQKLRNIQEVLASGEFKTGMFYHNKGSYPAANNRLQSLVDQYPLFSGADEALWQLADGYTRMGDRFEDKAAGAYARIVKDYPLSNHVEEATQKLQAMNRPVPQADPVAYARMKYELENRDKAGVLSHVMGVFKHSPDTRAAAKSGTPAMAANRPTIPLSVPAALAGAQAGGASDVSVQTVTDSTALDTKPDARQNLPAAGAAGGGAPAIAGTTPGAATGTETGSGDRSSTTDVSGKPADSAAAATNLPPPTNHQQAPKKKKKDKEKKKADTAQSQ
ncbi:MAG TPA: outer membrane protein assembly factor BamD [Bryobacteraceae bacterium]|nr:outer membrane protein assembly factor BamD [Bryobacteraceae bacterium]